MKVYAIANEVHECYGQGDYGKEHRICRQGSYGTGGFPPVFASRQAAQNYLAGIEYFTGKVVELEFVAESAAI
jgi:hypothetical protein